MRKPTKTTKPAIDPTPKSPTAPMPLSAHEWMRISHHLTVAANHYGDAADCVALPEVRESLLKQHRDALALSKRTLESIIERPATRV